ncbi:Gfo/Idh/MocA family protein [Salinibacter ruber]|uniref:Gfo/Idh/MocA family protein n=1 Tax=Salinibacter ruber TaxID=146919 RepID=UPI00216A84A5|nr:Gfo/Idh/MocA family oxidoreductase [Salinibacter ruber]MCS3683878.1 putative dehydrogenase [Salinibacter ruber]
MNSSSASHLTFAILGCGRIAQRHARHISNVGRLEAVCDVVEQRAVDLGREYGAATYTDLDDMLQEATNVDVVSVCTPNGLHAQHTIRAAQAGYHVLCEKPMALSVADCGQMIKEAEKANKRLFVVKQNRFNPPVAAVKELVESGHLGRIYSVQVNCFWNRHQQYYKESAWRGSKELDGGVLYTQFSHFIDLMYWLVGDVEQTQAVEENFNHSETTEFADTGVVSLQFVNGAIGGIHFTTNAHGGNMEGSITLFGEEGTVKIGGEYLNELEYQDLADHTIEGVKSSAGANDYGTYQGSMSNHDKVYENLVRVFRGDEEAATVGYEGLKTVEIIENIYAAAGSEVPVM